jgi:hypothetical protein
MPSDQSTASPASATDLKRATERPPLTVAAQRALAEAATRRAEGGEAAGEQKDTAKEINGRGGLEPTRYGDWEVNGLTSDF